MIAWGRIAVGGLALLRSAVVWQRVGFEPEHVLGSLGALGLAVAFSTWALFHLRRRSAGPAFLTASVGTDLVATGLALSTNSLWPQPAHPGLLFMPDLVALVLVVGASALRLSVGVSAFAGALAFVVLAALVGLEASIAPLSSGALQNLTGIAGLVLAAAVVAGVVAARSRRLVRAGAVRAIAAERAVGNLDWLLRNHHDLRSRLSGAGLNADLLVRALSEDAPREGRLRRKAEAVRRDLDLVNDVIAEAKRRSHGELLAHKPVAPVATVAVAEGVISLSQSLLAGIPISLECPGTLPPVLVSGGAEGLHYLLAQVIHQAGAGASRVRVILRVEPGSGDVGILVRGEGAASPQFAEASTDLLGVERIATASGGSAAPEGHDSGGESGHGPSDWNITLPSLGAGDAPGATSGPSRLSPEVRTAIGTLFETTRARGERLISSWRIALAFLSIARSLWVWQAVGFGLGAPPLRMALVILAGTVVFSAFMLWRAREGVGTGLLLASTTVDWAICTGALLTNVIWPEPDSLGILFMPELGAFVVPVFVSTLRLSPALTLVSFLLCAIGLGGVVQLDLLLNGNPGGRVFEHLSALFAFLVGMAIVAGLSVARSGSLVEQSARRGLAAQRAGRNLRLVLDQQRDAQGLLHRALGRARQLASRLAGHGGGSTAAGTAARQLRSDLETVQRDLSDLEARSYPELLARAAPIPTDVEAALRSVIAELAARFPNVRFQADGSLRHARVSIAGGVDSLCHVLQNLLVNACEGDGQRGAEHVHLSIAAGPASMQTLEVRDDGPGFGRDAAPQLPLRTTKTEGSGLGLELVRQLVTASGGHLSLGNGPEGGACVRVALPAA